MRASENQLPIRCLSGENPGVVDHYSLKNNVRNIPATVAELSRRQMRPKTFSECPVKDHCAGKSFADLPAQLNSSGSESLLLRSRRLRSPKPIIRLRRSFAAVSGRG